MNFFWFTLMAVFAAMLVAFASSATARDILTQPAAFLLEWLSNFVEELSAALTSLLLLALTALCFWLALKGGPDPPFVLTGRVVSEERVDSKPTPVVGASVRLEQYEARTQDDGSFVLVMNEMPEESTYQTLTITHPDYVTSCFRHDDPHFSARSAEAIELSPKMRIMVADFDGGGAADFEACRRNIESRLTLRDQIELLAQKEKEALLEELRINQLQRGIYDEKTLVKIGLLHGATHGVLGSIKKHDEGLLIECKLISFRTREINATAEVSISSSDDVALASAYVADRLLSQLCRIKILSPKSPARSGSVIDLRGYSTFRPKDWTVWISVLPAGISQHFPQEKVTPLSDGKWNAPSVHLGDSQSPAQAATFDVYAVITDPEKTREIESYLKSRSSGLDLVSWVKTQQCQILDSIRVTRF